MLMLAVTDVGNNDSKTKSEEPKRITTHLHGALFVLLDDGTFEGT